jgi:hypothetical protein
MIGPGWPYLFASRAGLGRVPQDQKKTSYERIAEDTYFDGFAKKF